MAGHAATETRRDLGPRGVKESMARDTCTPCSTTPIPRTPGGRGVPLQRHSGLATVTAPHQGTGCSATTVEWRGLE
jgi:hypothetical protein